MMMVVKPIIITATAMAFVQMATAASCCDGVTDPKLSSSVVAIASRGAKGGPLTKDLVTRVTTLKNFLVHHNDNDTSALELLDAPAVNVSASIHLDSHGNRWPAHQMNTFANKIYLVHNQETVETRRQLQNKWSNKTLISNEVDVWHLLTLLHFTVDHSDSLLHYTSQFTHCIQVYNGIKGRHFSEEAHDHTFKKDLMLAALIHDLGKLLALVGNENDAHVDCMNRVIPGSLPAQEKGLDNIPIQWNHDEYGYQRLAAVRPRLPKRILASVRYHSLRELTGQTHRAPHKAAGGYDVTSKDIHEFQQQLTDEDRQLIPFILHMRHYDQSTKIRTDFIPDTNVTEIKDLLAEYFPGGKMRW